MTALIEQLVDFYIQHPDPEEIFALPLRLVWLYREDILPPESPVPITPVHTADLEVRDQNGVLVFDTRNATDFRVSTWESYEVIEWSDANTVVQLTLAPEGGLTEYADWSPGLDLDPRTTVLLQKRLESLQLGLETLRGVPIKFQAGYNSRLAVTAATSQDGQRLNTVLTVSFPPGAGLGRYPADCGDTRQIRTINKTGADDAGRFLLAGDNCTQILPVVEEILSEEIPAVVEGGPTIARQVRLRSGALQFRDDCQACYSCDDFIAVYEALRRLNLRTADLLTRAQAARDLYAVVRERFLSQKICREAQTLHISAESFCPCTVGFAAGVCNLTDECLENLVIPISFVYTDGEGSGVTANSNPADAAILPNSTFRGGFVDPDRRRSVSREPYKLVGSWPNYYAIFPRVNPRQKPYVSWYMRYSGCTDSEQISVVVDAYAVATVGSGSNVIPGYTSGVGPTAPAAYEARLVSLPVKTSTSLLPECE